MKKTLLAITAMVSMCSYAQMPVEGFEDPWVGEPAAPPGWTVVNQDGPGQSWKQGPATPESPPFSGSYAAFINKENVAPGASVPKDWLISPSFTITPNAQLQFNSRLTLPDDQGGIYKVLIGTDPANLSSFTEIYTATELQLNPVQTEYILKQITIPAVYTGQQMHIAFYMEGDDADRWLIDDVGIFNACDAPSNLIASNITPTSVQLGWTENGEATSWEINVVNVSSVPTGVGIVASTNPFTVSTDSNGSPLAPGAYKYYVRSVCGDGGVSVWTGPFYFSTDVTFNNTIYGILRYDANGDNLCDQNDTRLPYMAVSILVDDTDYVVYTNYNGEYSLYGIEDGEHTLSTTPALGPAYPAPVVVTQDIEFTTEVDSISVSHCVPAPQPFADVLVSFNATSSAVPGFEANYNITVRNKGTLPFEDGSVALTFDDSRLDFVSASPYFEAAVSGNTITLNLNDIAANAAIGGNIKFNVKQPPVNTGGELLNFAAVLSEVDGDIDTSDNTSLYAHIITNSFDPNDITVHEGDKIFIDQADDYLTYTIRFQNTGNGNAINIRLENILDEQLDWATFEPVVSSHPNVIKRIDNKLEFYFENIQLPYESADEAGSNGFVTYRILPKPEFDLGDIVYNTAEIYFDFNEAIVTNTAQTEVVVLAGLNTNKIAIAKLYPNPVKDQLHIALQQGELQLVTIHDINGRLCFSANAEIIDTAKLTSGIYFVKVTTDAGSADYKIIKH